MLNVSKNSILRLVTKILILLAWYISPFTALADPVKECFKAPRPIVAPQEGIIYRSPLVASSKNAPGTIDFQSAEHFLLTIYRGQGATKEKQTDSAPVGVKISLKNNTNGEYTVYCEISRVQLEEPFRDLRFFVYSSEARNKEWRVQIIDHGYDLPVGAQEPLQIQIARFPSQRYAPDSNGTPHHTTPYSLTCEEFWGRKYYFRSPPRQVGLISPSQKIRTFFVRSRGPLQVEFRTDVTKLPPQSVESDTWAPKFYLLPEVTVAVKGDDAGPFVVGCSQSPRLAGNKLEAVQFTLDPSFLKFSVPVWRVDITSESRPKFETKVVLRYPHDDPISVPFPTEFQCAPPLQARPTRVAFSTKAFSGSTVLQVTLDSDKPLSTQARTAVTKHLLLGMALWRPVCYLCTFDQLTIAKIDGQTYVLESLQTALNKFYEHPWISPSPNSLGIGGRQGKYDELMASMGARHQPRGLQSNSGYIELKSPNVGIQGLCKDKFSDLPIALQRIRVALCDGEQGVTPAKPLTASTNLSFLHGPLSGCQNEPNTIACESSALKIEFNAKDYTFLSHGTREPISGSGNRQVNLLHVLVHEIGHWIGIGHLSQRGSIMNDTMDSSRCIDSAASNALNVLSAGGAFPITIPHAFKWED